MRKTWEQFKQRHPGFNLRVFLQRRNITSVHQAIKKFNSMGYSASRKELESILQQPEVVEVEPKVEVESTQVDQVDIDTTEKDQVEDAEILGYVEYGTE